MSYCLHGVGCGWEEGWGCCIAWYVWLAMLSIKICIHGPQVFFSFENLCDSAILILYIYSHKIYKILCNLIPTNIPVRINCVSMFLLFWLISLFMICIM